MYFPADESKEGIGYTFERSGELVASSQLTTFTRDCAMKFWEKLQADEANES